MIASTPPATTILHPLRSIRGVEGGFKMLVLLTSQFSPTRIRCTFDFSQTYVN